jgi:hypothetical protein
LRINRFRFRSPTTPIQFWWRQRHLRNQFWWRQRHLTNFDGAIFRNSSASDFLLPVDWQELEMTFSDNRMVKSYLLCMLR